MNRRLAHQGACCGGCPTPDSHDVQPVGSGGRVRGERRGAPAEKGERPALVASGGVRNAHSELGQSAPHFPVSVDRSPPGILQHFVCVEWHRALQQALRLGQRLDRRAPGALRLAFDARRTVWQRPAQRVAGAGTARPVVRPTIAPWTVTIAHPVIVARHRSACAGPVRIRATLPEGRSSPSPGGPSTFSVCIASRYSMQPTTRPPAERRSRLASLRSNVAPTRPAQ